ncbi:MAG: dephospho-CoA kinase [Pseudomonadota bacterium]
MLVVGLTGGIGSGKSEVSRRFADLGVPVIDTDQISRELVAPGSPALDAIAAAFGRELVSAGRLRRGRLRDMVFTDSKARARLEDILHPRIREEVARALSAIKAPYAIVVIPLLLETRYPIPIDRILVVDAPVELQIARTRRRDALGVDAVHNTLRQQANRAQRLAAADDVITNDGKLDALDNAVHRLHDFYLVESARHA